MAVFALWRDSATRSPADRLHRQLAGEVHIAAEYSASRAIETHAGTWQLAAFACATHFYAAEAQIWIEPGRGACVLHGVAWRLETGRARPIDAAGFAALIDQAGDERPSGIAGEYAVARLTADGTLRAFTDCAGVHQLFHRPDSPGMVASRAAFLALLAGDWTPDPESGLWMATIGYRVGHATGWHGVRQLRQGALLTGKGVVAAAGTSSSMPHGMRFDGEELLERGVAEAIAAARLAAGDGPMILPVTGGKDSRAVLALCLAAGLEDRLTLTTRGPIGHPDVAVAELIAATLGLPHRREEPRATNIGEGVEHFATALAEHVYQTDGGMGGWDLLVGEQPGVETMLTGHLGEVLKGVGKPEVAITGDPVAMVARQAPFDPMDLLRPDARAELVASLVEQAADIADPGDLSDLFYYRNRVPNWLGGIRGVRSHERQPIMPLGSDGLVELAFRLTPAERSSALIPYRIVRDCAPELLGLPFAHQRWSKALPGAPDIAPLLAPAGTALFGNWQWQINRSPEVRAWLRDFVASADIPLWEGIDRDRLIARLIDRRFDYRDGIALLGLIAAAFHQSGYVRPRKIGAAKPAVAGWGRPVRPAVAITPDPVAITGHVDSIVGPVDDDGREAVSPRQGAIEIGGWAWSPTWPGASPLLEARADGNVVGSTEAAHARPDLKAAGIGDGGYGFALTIDAAKLVGAKRLTIGRGASLLASWELNDAGAPA